SPSFPFRPNHPLPPPPRPPFLMEAAAAASPGSSSLEAVATAFRSRVNELQDLALARNMYPATAVTDLTAVDTSVTAMEAQVQAIRRRLQEELDAIPKAKKLVEKSLKQQQKLQHMLANMPPGMREDIVATPLEQSLSDYLMLLPISVVFTFI
uniref:Uncharacterized protein n=1 Tax=Aegilops tauschii subsp. strangulata TaxID=200361 RepID=A0A453BHA8_AEGTS